MINVLDWNQCWGFFFEDTGAICEEGYALAVPTNIKTLLAGNAVEWARIEFKETWDAEASLKTICAFANDIDNWGGGYLVIGVEEKDGRAEHGFSENS